MRALDQSIEKWEKLLAIAKKEKGKSISDSYMGYHKFGESDFRIGAGECPLCTRYNRNCRAGCPVYKKTGETYCYCTPYHEISWMVFSAVGTRKKVTPKLIKLIEDEVKFLKSLKPARTKKVNNGKH